MASLCVKWQYLSLAGCILVRCGGSPCMISEICEMDLIIIHWSSYGGSTKTKSFKFD